MFKNNKIGKLKTAVALSVLIAILIFGLISFLIIFKNKKSGIDSVGIENNTENKIENKFENPEIAKEDLFSSKLAIIDDYQKRYFEIVKRNDVFLVLESDKNANKDLKELKELFDEVKKNIFKNQMLYIKYEQIIDAFRENNGQTTLEMNDFALRKYEAVDKLLNDAYKALKLKLSENEFETLKISQRAWLNEVEKYKTVFESKDFGTIGTLIKLDYEINMRCFRTLLLMMLIDEKAQLSDYLGEWTEILAGRIYVKIEARDDKVIVTYGGANSAYSHGETIYICEYDSASYNVICNSAKHTEQFLSCNGISSEDNLDKFLECSDKNPNLVKDDYKTHSDNKKRTLSLIKGGATSYVADRDEFLPEDRKNEIKKNYENVVLYFLEDKDLVFYKYKK